MNRDVCTHACVRSMPIPIDKKKWKKKKKKRKRGKGKTRLADRAVVCGDCQIYSLLAGGIARASNVTLRVRTREGKGI